MRTVFADACYWIACFNPRDDLHAKAREISDGLGSCRIVTSEMVLVEFLNGLSGRGLDLRKKAANIVTCLMNDPNIEVIHKQVFSSGALLSSSGKGRIRNGA